MAVSLYRRYETGTLVRLPGKREVYVVPSFVVAIVSETEGSVLTLADGDHVAVDATPEAIAKAMADAAPQTR